MRFEMIQPRSALVLVAALGCVFLTSFGNPARADLFFNHTLSFQVQDTNQGSTTPVNFLVNDTTTADPPEVLLNGANVVGGTMTVTDHVLFIKYNQAAVFDTATFNGYIIRDVDTNIPAITSVVVDPATTLAGFNQARITFDSKDIFLNVSGLSARVGDVLQVDVNPTAVPEPGPVALFAVGSLACGAVAWVRRRRGTSSVARR